MSAAEQPADRRLRRQLADATEAVNAAYRDTTRLIRLFQVLGQHTRPDELVDQALAVLSEGFFADVTCVAGVSGDALLVTGSCGLAEDDPAYRDGWPCRGAAAEALAGGVPLARGGAALTADDLPGSVASLGITSAAWVPLPDDDTGDLDGDGGAGGLLALFRRRGEPFGQSDLAVLSSVAHRLWLAVRERERSAVMERLAQSGHRLTRHLELAPLLDEAVDVLRYITGADRAWIVTVDDGRERVRAGVPAVGAARDAGPGAAPGGAVLRMPVPHASTPQTVLYVGRDRPRPFPRYAREATTIFANQLGVAIENAELCRALRVAATHDSLTGLANRVLVRQRLDEALGRRAPGHVGLLFCDLDRFKAVNDRLGHETGDDLLQQVAARLRTSVRADDLLARFGGDEFVVVIDGVDDLAEVAEIGWRVSRALEEPFGLHGERVRVSASVGGVLGVRGRATASAMLRDADAAMYAAKDQGAGMVQVFDEAASHRSLDRLDLRSELLHALDRDELRLHYQPIVALGSGRVLGFEALLRWDHPQRGTVSPDEFIPHAEDTGAIVPIGQWVVREACRQLAAWSRPGGPPVAVSVNVSAVQLARPDLVRRLLDVVRDCAAAPGAVWLELTEHSCARDGVAEGAAALRAAGVRFALDDFGTAYSNLGHLKRLPFDRVKIDRSFVGGLDESDTDRGIARAIMAMARSLDLDVVAEGIETDRQRAALAALGCGMGQGNLLSPPLTADEATALLAAGRVPAPRADGQPGRANPRLPGPAGRSRYVPSGAAKPNSP